MCATIILAYEENNSIFLSKIKKLESENIKLSGDVKRLKVGGFTVNPL